MPCRRRVGSTDILTETNPLPETITAAVETDTHDAAAPAAAPAEDTMSDYPDYPDEPAESGFAALGLSEPIVRAVTEKGYTTPTPIQAQAIPYVLMGRDLLGCAQTGTGKTAGFTLPMLDILDGSRARARMPRSLILEPTRELALQVAENFVEYGKYLKLTHALVIGGESMSDQKEILMRGVDVLIATPGRLMDMFDRGTILLTDVKVLVIDEADRMLDMGFIPDVERIVSMLPPNRQTLFFSATIAPEIRRLADAFLQNPKEITVSKSASVATTITEAHTLVAETDKREALRRLIRSEDVQNALIFCNRKRDVDILYKSLSRHGFSVGALHGDMAQSVRFATLEKFKAGEVRLLCCSDVAARGIDIGGLSHVFNFDVPHHAEDYVHRIGRTGRAGREGRAFTLATPEDRINLQAIEKLIGHDIPRMQVEGLDTVEWAESDGRRRGRGGRPAAAEKPAGRSGRKPAEKRDDKNEARPPRAAEPVAAAAPAPEAAAPDAAAAGTKPAPVRRIPRATRAAVAPAPEPQAPDAHALPPELAPQPDIAEGPALPAEPALRERAPRDDSRRRDSRRGEGRRDGGKRDEPRREAAPREEARRDEPRRDEPRRDTGPRDDTRRDEPRRFRRDDDLGPSVLGFGDEVPAFMLVAARPNRAHAEPTPDSATDDDSEA
jgi:superfamily II DNA/RNA helicase